MKGQWSKEDLFLHMEEVTDKMKDICRKKNNDYTGVGVSPFSNFERVEQMGICTTEQGFLTRMTDKMSRIASFASKVELQVKDEGVEDTLIDLANYSLLMLGYIRQQKEKENV